jgi:hypothetical protein
VLLAEVVDAGRAGFEDQRPEQTDHGDLGEVERVDVLAATIIASNCRCDRPSENPLARNAVPPRRRSSEEPRL